uniref:Uncharacterized protein n=1 Tax=viral metagenome TaxID=1070528 RepID=A0A6H2A087_9ZZZZ
MATLAYTLVSIVFGIVLFFFAWAVWEKYKDSRYVSKPPKTRPVEPFEPYVPRNDPKKTRIINSLVVVGIVTYVFVVIATL